MNVSVLQMAEALKMQFIKNGVRDIDPFKFAQETFKIMRALPKKFEHQLERADATATKSKFEFQTNSGFQRNSGLTTTGRPFTDQEIWLGADQVNQNGPTDSEWLRANQPLASKSGCTQQLNENAPSFTPKQKGSFSDEEIGNILRGDYQNNNSVNIRLPCFLDKFYRKL